jgi:serine/threonine protein kinase
MAATHRKYVQFSDVDTSESIKVVMERERARLNIMRARLEPPLMFVTPPPKSTRPKKLGDKLEASDYSETMAIHVNKQWEGGEYHTLKNELIEMARAGVFVASPISSVISLQSTARIGKGVYGSVYRGTTFRSAAGLPPNVVAVKKYHLSMYTMQGDSICVEEEDTERMLNSGMKVFNELGNLKEAAALFDLNYNPYVFSPKDVSVDAKRAGHQNVIAMYKLVCDTTEDEQVPRLYMVMEYAPGGTLGGRIGADVHFLSTLDSKLAACQGLANGLAYIHSKGYTHRDIHAFNILVGHSGVLKFADFGLCSNDTDPVHVKNILVQNMLGRAPEIVLRYMQYTNAIDVWSLGVLFYLIFTRSHLFALTIHDGEHRLLHDMIMHFGPIDVAYLGEIYPCCVPGAADIFAPTIMHASYNFQALDPSLRVRTTITENSGMGELFSRMMQFNHNKRMDAANISACMNVLCGGTKQ